MINKKNKTYFSQEVFFVNNFYTYIHLNTYTFQHINILIFLYFYIYILIYTHRQKNTCTSKDPEMIETCWTFHGSK